jgi:hypothetical protein
MAKNTTKTVYAAPQPLICSSSAANCACVPISIVVRSKREVIPEATTSLGGKNHGAENKLRNQYGIAHSIQTDSAAPVGNQTPVTVTKSAYATAEFTKSVSARSRIEGKFFMNSTSLLINSLF